ncbi:transcription factor bHLH145 [Neltuma alba]|uniref:transcription factor bHLH145 n=1 Tax=Neltuma alba TaxID=207710 RepID=UPI0010A44337|nr:transcription factor bHLH145 [Prosopis alba]
MGKDFGTWIPELHFDQQSPNLSSFGANLDAGKQNVSAFMNPGIYMTSENYTIPDYASPMLPHSQLGQSNEPCGWYYGSPPFRQAFMPAPNIALESKLPAGQKVVREGIAPNGILGFPKKQFIVIDQTVNQTTMVYSSGFGRPIECLASWPSRMHGPDCLNGNEPSFRRDLNNLNGPTLTGKVDKNQGTEAQSEMHEDTEEINALLYSDSDGYSTEDDEVTSTGHSPSIMTTHDDQDFFCGSNEGVGSSAGKTKKRKLSDDGAHDDLQFMDSASSLNLNRSFDNGYDAESRCSSGSSEGSDKKMRKERIRDVLNVLQTVIPGGKERDPVRLLDEAIHCLKLLKRKARALGLHDS